MMKASRMAKIVLVTYREWEEKTESGDWEREWKNREQNREKSISVISLRYENQFGENYNLFDVLQSK